MTTDKKRLRVGVLFGGRSGEHEVSLVSAASVIRGLDPRTTRISEVMSTTLRTVAPDAHCEEALLMMQTHGVRHLPVCEGNTLVGFLSVRDLMRHTLDEKSGEAEMMRAYIQTSVS